MMKKYSNIYQVRFMRRQLKNYWKGWGIMKIGDLVYYRGENEKYINKVVKVFEIINDIANVGYSNDNFWTTIDVLELPETENNPIIPDHYKQGNIDTIAFCESFFTKEQLRGAYRFNVIKYNHRYLDKNGLEDLKKAEFYLKKLIELEADHETD